MRRNSILCPHCRKLISRDEERCPYCGLSHPGRRPTNPLQRWSATPAEIVKPLLAINIAFYIMTLLLGPISFSGFGNPLSFLAPDSRALIVAGATGTLPVFKMHRWWSLVSASFLHGSLLHLLFNLAALNYLGRICAEVFGLYRFLLIYLVSGVIGFYLSCLAGVMLTIGASAALCGLIGALLFYGLNRGGEFGRLVVQQVRGWIIGLLLIGFFLPSINNWGHGGGVVAGFALAALLGYREKGPEGILLRQVAILVCLAGLAILGWSVVQVLLFWVAR